MDSEYIECLMEHYVELLQRGNEHSDRPLLRAISSMLCHCHSCSAEDLSQCNTCDGAEFIVTRLGNGGEETCSNFMLPVNGELSFLRRRLASICTAHDCTASSDHQIANANGLEVSQSPGQL